MAQADKPNTTSLSRRAVMAGAAMLPALAVPAFAGKPKITLDDFRQAYAKLDPNAQAFLRALASEHAEVELAGADPIFAAIERQKQLWATWTSIIEPKEVGSAAYAAYDKLNDAAQTAYNDGMDELLATKPTTRAGATALIAHCLAEDSDLFCGKDEPTYALLRTLEKAMPALDAAVQS